jgi:hypothetical protein
MPAKSRLPKHVVRFYGTVDFALDAIGAPAGDVRACVELNDPFDPYFFFETDFQGKYSELLKYVRKKHPEDERHLEGRISHSGGDRPQA